MFSTHGVSIDVFNSSSGTLILLTDTWWISCFRSTCLWSALNLKNMSVNLLNRKRFKLAIIFRQFFMNNYSQLRLRNGKLSFVVKLPPLRSSIQKSFIYFSKPLGFLHSQQVNEEDGMELKFQVLNWHLRLAAVQSEQPPCSHNLFSHILLYRCMQLYYVDVYSRKKTVTISVLTQRKAKNINVYDQ